MSKKIPLYLCDKKCDCNSPCYRECRLTHDINHAVRDDKGTPIIGACLEDPVDTWSKIMEVEIGVPIAGAHLKGTEECKKKEAAK